MVHTHHPVGAWRGSPPAANPAGQQPRFSRVRVRGNRAFIAGHGPSEQGETKVPRGKVGAELTVEQGYEASRLTALNILSSLKAELGDLDRVTAWLRVLGMGHRDLACGLDALQPALGGGGKRQQQAGGEQGGFQGWRHGAAQYSVPAASSSSRARAAR